MRQGEDEDARGPYDAADELIKRESDEISLKCTVYFNPNHPVASELDQLESRLFTEIAPRKCWFEFRRLSEDDLKLSSPFSTRAAENLFLKRGFAWWTDQSPVPEPAPRRRAGNAARHRSREESQEALQVLTLMTERVLRSVQRLMPRRTRPKWLNHKIMAILAPVCGKVSREIGDETAAPDIPIVREGGLLLGCTNFVERRTVLASYISTPNTAAREGRAALKRWSEAGRCNLYADSATEQIKVELSDRVRHFGADFDLAGAALWMCQCVMQMRLSVEDVRRRTAASWFALEDKQEARRVEDMRLLDRLFEGYGKCGENSTVALEPPTLTRRVMEIFYGVAFDTWEDCDPSNLDDRAFLDILSIVYWIRQLRLAGRATLDCGLARDICNFTDREDPDFVGLFSGHDGRELDNMLRDMLPRAGWQALYDAACIVLDVPGAKFAVSYAWQGLTEYGPSGHVHQDDRYVEIVGPLLMLPLHAADYWRDAARKISMEGLYAYGRRPVA